MSDQLIFNDVFLREIKKAKESLKSFGAETATIKYTFFDKEDKDLVHDLSFTIRPRRDDEWESISI